MSRLSSSCQMRGLGAVLWILGLSPRDGWGFLECFPSLNYRSQPRSQNAIMGLDVCFEILKFINLQWPCFVTCVSGYNIQQKFWLFLSVVAYLSTQELGDWEFKAAWAIAQVPGVCISTKAERGGGVLFLFFKKMHLFSFYVYGYFVCIYICASCGCRSLGHGEGVRCPVLGVTGGCGSLCGCWELNPGALKEQLVLLDPEPPL